MVEDASPFPTSNRCLETHWCLARDEVGPLRRVVISCSSAEWSFLFSFATTLSSVCYPLTSRPIVLFIMDAQQLQRYPYDSVSSVYAMGYCAALTGLALLFLTARLTTRLLTSQLNLDDFSMLMAMVWSAMALVAVYARNYSLNVLSHVGLSKVARNS